MSGQMSFILDGDPSRYEEKLDITGHITSDFPASFVMSSTGDMCLPYAEPMVQKLTEKGVEAEMHLYGDEDNRLPHVFHIDIRNPYAAQCNDDECGFFRNHLG